MYESGSEVCDCEVGRRCIITTTTTTMITVSNQLDSGEPGAVAGTVLGVVAIMLLTFVFLRRRRRHEAHLRAEAAKADVAETEALLNEIHAVLNARAKARFVLAYKQLLPTTDAGRGHMSMVRVSEEEVDRQFAAVELPFDSVKLGEEVSDGCILITLFIV